MKDRKNPPSILVVEDEITICELLCITIQRSFPEATIYAAGNGSVGVDLFNEHMPELVITDVNMPVMDGIEMATRIKAVKADARIIVITGYSDRGYFEKLSEIGFCEYLLKPVELAKLFGAIESCLPET
jgi:YesN/AraC family two-component response regulator